jgi:hypothetical protein
MAWRRTDPVQTIGALIAIGDAAVDAFVTSMSRKSRLLQSLAVEHGDGWAAIFSGTVPRETGMVLPRLDGVTALYEIAPRIWLPAGVTIDAPAHVQGALIAAMFDHYDVAPPAIVVPRFGDTAAWTDEADLYVVREPVAFHRSLLCARAA